MNGRYFQPVAGSPPSAIPISGDTVFRLDPRGAASFVSRYCRSVLVCSVWSWPFGIQLWGRDTLCLCDSRTLQRARSTTHLLNSAVVSGLRNDDSAVGIDPLARPAARRSHHVGSIGARIYLCRTGAVWSMDKRGGAARGDGQNARCAAATGEAVSEGIHHRIVIAACAWMVNSCARFRMRSSAQRCSCRVNTNEQCTEILNDSLWMPNLPRHPRSSRRSGYCRPVSRWPFE